MGLFSRIASFFFGPKQFDTVELIGEIHLKGLEIRVPFRGQPLQFVLGRKKGRRTLHCYPYRPLDSSPDQSPYFFILFDPEKFFDEIAGFVRLEYGETLLIGRHDATQQHFFHFPKDAELRHFTIAHAGDALILKDFNTESGTYVKPLNKPSLINKMVERRRQNLRRVRQIFGGPLRPLPPDVAMEALQQVNDILANEAHRPPDSDDEPGGVLTFPEAITPIIIGDLHARVDNLLKILSENNFLDQVEKGRAALIILGDAIHSEEDGEMEEMESSILMMDLIFKLKIRFPRGVFYIRGNHDCFSPDVSKGGVAQGLLWDLAIRRERGDDFRQEMEKFYGNLPYLAISREFIACHAAPPKAQLSVDMLINVRQYPGIIRELIWNRVKRPNYPAGYTRSDVARFRRNLGVLPDTPFIVAHNPLSSNESVWMDAGDIPNHHIVFSGKNHCISIFTRVEGKMTPMRFPSENLLDYVNNLNEEAT